MSEYPKRVVDAVARVRARDGLIRAFILTRLEQALAEAEHAQAGALAGLPFGLKDLWDSAGIPTTAASARFQARVPEHSSPVLSALTDAGAILLGKTNASDMGLAMESQSYVGGTTNNPHDVRRTAGGSSGGAAAAVADRMVAFDWGSDFGGSIRLPSAFCGVYGMRLSSEAWPVRGHFPVPPPSLLHMNGQGPITPDLPLMRRLLEATQPVLKTGKSRSFSPRAIMIYAPEGRSAGQWPGFAAEVEPVLVRAGLPIEQRHGLLTLGKAGFLTKAFYGVHFEEFLELDEFGLFDGLLAVGSSLIFRGRLGDRRFHPRTAETLLLLAIGRAFLFRDQARTVREAQLYRDEVGALWDRGFVIALPSCTFPAPRHGRSVLNPFISDTVMPGNLVDATGLALPLGHFADGLPRSLQLWGPPGSELTLVELAQRFGL